MSGYIDYALLLPCVQNEKYGIKKNPPRWKSKLELDIRCIEGINQKVHCNLIFLVFCYSL